MISRFEVHQHWDPLQVCVVGRSYPPEFYSFVKDKKVRQIFETLAIQTEEDFQQVETTLQQFGVEVWRPDIPPGFQTFDQTNNQFRPPPMTPRDDMVMIGDRFFRRSDKDWNVFYRNVRDPSWPTHTSCILDLPDDLQQECREIHGWGSVIHSDWDPYRDIIRRIQARGNTVQTSLHHCIGGAGVARLGHDLVIGPAGPLESGITEHLQREFSDYDLHIAATDGHMDGHYCPVCPGLIVSHFDSDLYEKIFPDWQVVKVAPTLDNQPMWQKHRTATQSRWWLPDFEQDSKIVEVVEHYLQNFVGFVAETAFEVNMLIIDPANVIAFSYNPQVEKALNSYGINLHVVPFRHRYFWDGGAHCVTLDLHRTGQKTRCLKGTKT